MMLLMNGLDDSLVHELNVILFGNSVPTAVSLSYIWNLEWKEGSCPEKGKEKRKFKEGIE